MAPAHGDVGEAGVEGGEDLCPSGASDDVGGPVSNSLKKLEEELAKAV